MQAQLIDVAYYHFTMIINTARLPEKFRNTKELFAHARQQKFVDDKSFADRYGVYFEALKQACPQCFDLSLYHLVI